MLIADPNPPLMDEVLILRTEGGKEVQAPMWFEFHAPYPPIPARLVIASGWDGRHWGEWRSYDATERPAAGPVREFVLGRDSDALLLTPPGGDRSPVYVVTLGRIPDLDACTCRGHMATRPHGHFCKHIWLMRWALDQFPQHEENDEQSSGGEGGPEGVGGGGRADRRAENAVREGTGREP